MKISNAVSVLLLGAAAACAAPPASAADFYILYFSKSDKNVILLDASSVTPGPDSHLVAHIADINDMDLWNDDTVEVDCAGSRMKILSSFSHLAGGDTLDRSNVPGMVGVWNAITKDSLGALEHDAVCQWPSNKANFEVYTASDLLAAEHAISNTLTSMGDN